MDEFLIILCFGVSKEYSIRFYKIWAFSRIFQVKVNKSKSKSQQVKGQWSTCWVVMLSCNELSILTFHWWAVMSCQFDFLIMSCHELSLIIINYPILEESFLIKDFPLYESLGISKKPIPLRIRMFTCLYKGLTYVKWI